MPKPTNDSSGTITVPEVDLQRWLEHYYLKPAPGTLVAWGKVKIQNDIIVCQYSTSNNSMPQPPADPDVKPA